MPFQQIGDLRLHYESWGQGPPVLIIPGVPAVVSDCACFGEAWDDAFRVIAFDNRGSGRSDKPEGHYTIRAMADDAAELLSVLGIRRASVFGFSMGGMIAQELVINHPERVDRLVLACTHSGAHHGAAPVRQASEAFSSGTEDWAERIRELSPYSFAPGFAHREPEVYRKYVEKKSRDVQPLKPYRAQIRAVIEHDTLDRLDRIDHPTLVITGDEDQIVPDEHSRLLADRIANSRLVLIPHAGHLFWIEKPEAMDKIRSFLAEGRD